MRTVGLQASLPADIAGILPAFFRQMLGAGLEMTQRIMFATDTPGASLVAALAERGFEIAIETQPTIAHEQLLMTTADLLVLDISDASRAIELLKSVRSSSELNRTSILVLADWGTGQATLALSNGADAFEPKPIDATRLIATVDQLLRPRLVMTANATEE